MNMNICCHESIIYRDVFELISNWNNKMTISLDDLGFVTYKKPPVFLVDADK